MGILASTVSIQQYRVIGDPFSAESICERLAAKRFIPIDDRPEAMSAGWVTLDNPACVDFTPEDVLRADWAAFSLRIDRRKVPAACLKQHMEQACAGWLQEHPGLQRVPKKVREELRDQVMAQLLAKTLAVPSVYDAVWDLKRGIVTFATHNKQACELFEALFKTTFDGCRLVVRYPYERAEAILDADLRGALQRANGASTDSVLDLIRENAWIGSDFLLWLAHVTANGGDGSEVLGWIGDKMALVGSGDGGKRKIAASGPMDRFGEVRAALRDGMSIVKGAIQMQKGEDVYSLALDADTFRFGSLKTPPVRLERDGLTDERSERVAVFYERMYLLQQAEEIFDSLLKTFLALRLTAAWTDQYLSIRKWVEGEQ